MLVDGLGVCVELPPDNPATLDAAPTAPSASFKKLPLVRVVSICSDCKALAEILSLYVFYI